MKTIVLLFVAVATVMTVQAQQQWRERERRGESDEEWRLILEIEALRKEQTDYSNHLREKIAQIEAQLNEVNRQWAINVLGTQQANAVINNWISAKDEGMSRYDFNMNSSREYWENFRNQTFSSEESEMHSQQSTRKIILAVRMLVNIHEGNAMEHSRGNQNFFAAHTQADTDWYNQKETLLEQRDEIWNTPGPYDFRGRMDSLGRLLGEAAVNWAFGILGKELAEELTYTLAPMDNKEYSEFLDNNVRVVDFKYLQNYTFETPEEALSMRQDYTRAIRLLRDNRHILSERYDILLPPTHRRVGYRPGGIISEEIIRIRYQDGRRYEEVVEIIK